MVSDGKSKMQVTVFAFLNKSSGARLLQSHTHRTVEIRIGRSIDGRKVVKNFSSEIKGANLIQFFDLIFGDYFVKIIRSLWHNGAFGSFRRGLQIIGAPGAHFVKINMYVRVPLVEKLKPRLAFHLRGAQPITIKFGQVVVAASIWPAFAVFFVKSMCLGESLLVGVMPTGSTVSTVGIVRGIDQDHSLVKKPLSFFVFVGYQVVSSQQSRVPTGGFIAIHAVAQK